jgi:uncharacterized RDD family membrane protein YckC
MTYPGERFGLPQRGPGAVADPWRRAQAFVVDLVLLAVVVAVAVPLLPSKATRIVVLLVFLGNVVVLPWWRGVTLGKWLMALRIVAAVDGEALLDQQGLTLPSAMARSGIVICGGGPLALLLLWRDEDRRTIVDLIVKTIVVNAA